MALNSTKILSHLLDSMKNGRPADPRDGRQWCRRINAGQRLLTELNNGDLRDMGEELANEELLREE